MTGKLITNIGQILSMNWLFGPIFDKELRVSSRRRRNYVLRFAYLLLLMFFMVLIWLDTVRSQSYYNSNVYYISRMAQAGRAIVVSLVWFQFITLSLVAIAMLSTSISEEIYSRTLGTLMTTPISSLQIVAGKLFSKLLQLILLLAISLPLLMVVRVLGGVPWMYVVSSVCITLVTIIFVGTLTIFFSAGGRRSYAIMLKTLLVILALYWLIPWVVAYIIYNGWGNSGLNGYGLFLCYVHSIAILSVMTDAMLNPGFSSTGLAGVTSDVWIWNCLITLGLSAVLLAVSVWRVRRVALRCAMGETGKKRRRRKRPRHSAHISAADTMPYTLPADSAAPADGNTVTAAALTTDTAATGATAAVTATSATAINASPVAISANAMADAAAIGNDIDYDDGNPIRPVKGPPVLWKELRTSFWYTGRRRAILLALGVLAALVATYCMLASVKMLDDRDIQTVYTLILTCIALLGSTIFSATGITSEKEARTWYLLLTTGLTDNSIIIGKAVGAFVRCVWLWLLVLGHITLFILVGYIHPIAFVHALMVMTGAMVFIIGSGLYCSARFKRTGSAVIVNMLIAVTLWLFIPLLMAFINDTVGDGFGSNVPVDVVCSGNPVIETVVFTDGASGRYHARLPMYDIHYNWPGRTWNDAGSTTVASFMGMVFYIALGVFLSWRARQLMRKRIF